jgi:hypothetical protein
LSYYEGGLFLAPRTVIDNPDRRKNLEPRYESAQRRRGLFGRR